MKLNYLVTLPILLVASAHTSHAIKGTYLPEAELSKSVCMIRVGKITQTYLPTYQNGYATGKAPFTIVDENIDMCSSTLIAPNAILTAAHCFTGNNEQDVGRGRFPYPKMVNGKLIDGCDAKTWPKNKKCIEDERVFGIVKNKWENVKLICPAPGGKTEERVLLQEQGYPNPLFQADSMLDSITRSNFDLAVWRFDQPITTTPVAPIETDEANTLASLRENALSCRAFGYGLDNNEKTGVLHGAYTPITKADRSILISDIASSQYSDHPTGKTDHGDSGGALFCKSPTGVDKLFGVVSRGGTKSLMETMGYEELSIFSKVAYHSTWIKKVLAEAPLTRSLESSWWDKFVLQYEIDQLISAWGETTKCLAQGRQVIHSDEASMLREQYQGLQERYKKALKLYHQYGDDAGLLRIKVRDIFTDSQKLSYVCRKYSGN